MLLQNSDQFFYIFGNISAQILMSGAQMVLKKKQSPENQEIQGVLEPATLYSLIMNVVKSMVRNSYYNCFKLRIFTV